MANFIMGLISLTIGVVILSSVFISTIKGTNTSVACVSAGGGGVLNATCSWSTAELALWGLLVIVGIAGMLYGVLNVFGLA